MKKNTKRFTLVLAIVMVLQVMFGMLAFAANNSQTTAVSTPAEAAGSVFPIYLYYTDENNDKYYFKSGTCFLIDPHYVVTCYHVAALNDQEVYEVMNNPFYTFNKNTFYKNYATKVSCDVVIGTLTLKATMTSVVNESHDYAVLKLSEPVINRPVFAIGDTSRDVKSLNKIITIGYPAAVNTDESTEISIDTSEKPHSATGEINKESVVVDGTNYFAHTAKSDHGSSGGPVLLEDHMGVIGIVAAKTRLDGSAEDFLLAVGIDELRDSLDTLGVVYISAPVNNGGGVEPECDHDWSESVNGCTTTKTCSKCGASTKTVTSDAHSYGEWEEIVPATKDAEGEKQKVCSICGDVQTETIPQLKGGLNTTTIIIIAVVVLVVVVVVIIIIMAGGKKKKEAAAPSIGTVPVSPIPTGAPVRPQVTVPNTGNSAPRPPVFDDGAGNTTVLNDGAGDTTVLGQTAAARSCLIRAKNGERIIITGSEFIIGKERRRVNYCIADNNSISRAHAKIVSRGGNCFIVDMNSTNFTFVNGARLAAGQEKPLVNGDKIKLADEEFEFKA